MSLPYGDPRSKKFVTNVGLITSDGPWGSNVMACEWSHHISYEPGLIMINVHAEDATADNINASKEFGVNLAAENQNFVASVAGGSTGKEVDKVAVLKELGVEFYKARKINVLMVKNAALNAECRLIETKQLGDHTMFVGEVVEASTDESIRPLLYHGGKFWKLGERFEKNPELVAKIKELVEKYRKT